MSELATGGCRVASINSRRTKTGGFSPPLRGLKERRFPNRRLKIGRCGRLESAAPSNLIPIPGVIPEMRLRAGCALRPA